MALFHTNLKMGCGCLPLQNCAGIPRTCPMQKRNCVLKLDLLILVFGCLSFFTKYLDQSAITNAYVSGMKADLHLHGNQLNYTTIVFWISYCTSMIPACYYLTRTRINVVLPALEAGWGLFTFGCAWAQNVQTIYAMRFFVGLCESCSFTGVIYAIGSWYKPGEIGRRVALFYIAAPLGTMFAGYLQSAAYTNLNHIYGLAGWRNPKLTYTSGFIAFPDVPHRSKPRFLTTAEHDLANSRLTGLTAPSQLKISRDIFKRVLARWHWYIFVAQWTLLNQNAQASGMPFNSYPSAKPDLYSVSRVNTLPTIATAVSVISAVVAGVVADRTGRFDILSLAVSIPTLIGTAMLVVWDVGEHARLAAFIITGSQGGKSI
ncbi:hypothetical protein MPDQ_000116 [Monascus purpureus]|uniref:Major facilitator superfamily (MFS) profile domain-containing protein n=1 Tax=Monascus purpureus TaxID=5098 RepID=A0A507R7R2_MONPU|nr:hypothetical protein MPDQ_000116 [Monascus purpureus]